KVIQVRVFRAPQPDPLLGNLQHQRRSEIAVRGHGRINDFTGSVVHAYPDGVSPSVRAQGRDDRELSGSYIRGDPGPSEMDRRYGLEPHGLPDSGGTRVVAVRIGKPCRLLASCLDTVARVPGAYGDLHCAPSGSDGGYVRGERGEPAAVPRHLMAVDPYCCVMVDGTEVEVQIGS